MKYYSWTIITIVAIAVIGGFFVVGSPMSKRLERFDERRMQDLSMVQSGVVYYWQQKGVLPPDLQALNDPIRGFNVPVDPESKKAYGYEVKSTSTFDLCADFALASPKDNSGAPITSYYSENWQHGAGRVCFSRTIDKDLLKPTAPTYK